MFPVIIFIVLDVASSQWARCNWLPAGDTRQCFVYVIDGNPSGGPGIRSFALQERVNHSLNYSDQLTQFCCEFGGEHGCEGEPGFCDACCPYDYQECEVRCPENCNHSSYSQKCRYGSSQVVGRRLFRKGADSGCGNRYLCCAGELDQNATSNEEREFGAHCYFTAGWLPVWIVVGTIACCCCSACLGYCYRGYFSRLYRRTFRPVQDGSTPWSQTSYGSSVDQDEPKGSE